ncbi:MAG TPA: hypothetical protein EYH20_08065, partial [Leucothrix sp.]|nr:hypothetical protein [Leucothrix sp.]
MLITIYFASFRVHISAKINPIAARKTLMTDKNQRHYKRMQRKKEVIDKNISAAKKE